jgi:hypothetical protein
MKHKWKGPIAMDHLKHFQSIVDFNYNNPNQYMSFIDILIHVVTTNTYTTTHILQHQQIQVGA